MGKSYEQSLQALDSSVHARLALEVTSRGAMPVLPIRNVELEAIGKAGESFNDHPFPLFYINGWLMRILGADAWSARLLPSAFAVGCVLLVVWLGSLLYSPPIGIAAGLVLAMGREMISYGARFQLDPAMIFFILLSFISWWKKYPIWTGIAAGIGVWMKGPVAFLIFPSAFFALGLTGKLTLRELKTLVVSALLALAVGSLVWIFSGWIGGWDMVADYWQRQVLGTAVGGRGYSQAIDHWMWWEILRKTYYPWLPLLLFSLWQIIRQKRWREPAVALTLSAVGVLILVISFMRFKFPHYYLPMYPFLALVTVDGIRNWIEERKELLALILVSLALVIPAFLLAMPIELAPEMFPALRRFNPLIQSYGSCRDLVLYVEGEEPYGSINDYSVELAFYTHRQVIKASCEDANLRVAAEHPSWILVSGRNFSECLTATVKKSYPVQYQFGNQYLLSSIIDPSKATNLTPLARELRAPLDCEAAPLPRNRYFSID